MPEVIYDLALPSRITKINLFARYEVLVGQKIEQTKTHVTYEVLTGQSFSYLRYEVLV